ncbi:hypothetical protein HWV62_24618 [Athelia sp. TMB]|nr:hypothetical protein HWV62_24618 [Athelia sp. TMB]
MFWTEDLHTYLPRMEPVILGSVCRQWRAVTLSESRLWTKIHIVIHRASRFADKTNLLQLFTARSGTYFPLSITINFEDRHDSPFLEWWRTSDGNGMASCQIFIDALVASVERWQNFSIQSPRGFIAMMEDALAQRLPWSLSVLSRLEIDEVYSPKWPGQNVHNLELHFPSLLMFAATPSLRHVCLRSFVFKAGGTRATLPWNQLEQMDHVNADVAGLLHLLRQAPNLIRCTNVSVSHAHRLIAGLPSPTHSLRALDIYLYPDVVSNFFQSIQLPGLRDLRLKMVEYQPRSHAQVRAFLSAAPMLQRLVLRLAIDSMATPELRALLQAVPDLEEFEFCHSERPSGGTTVYTDELLYTLALTACPPLLPSLRVLSLLGELDMNPVLFTDVIQSRMVGNGGAVLQKLHMHVLRTRRSLAIEELVKVKALLGDGADIHAVTSIPAQSPAFPDLL